MNSIRVVWVGGAVMIVSALFSFFIGIVIGLVFMLYGLWLSLR